jgi:hypothetical protein
MKLIRICCKTTGGIELSPSLDLRQRAAVMSGRSSQFAARRSAGVGAAERATLDDVQVGIMIWTFVPSGLISAH